MNKKHFIKIADDEDFGKNPNGQCGQVIELDKCHHHFPKYPVPETATLRRYNDGELKDGDFMKNQKKSVDVINRYLLCQTTEESETLEQLSFDEILKQIGMNRNDYLISLQGSV